MTPAPNIITAARRAQAKFPTPASVSIAQFGVESGWGKHMPPGSNNPFGMKSPFDPAGKPVGPFVTVRTREVDKYGQDYFIEAPFRVFASLNDAFAEHARLLATAPVYAAAFARLPDVTAFVRTMAPHYATDPHYAALILSIIHSDNLLQYDIGATA